MNLMTEGEPLVMPHVQLLTNTIDTLQNLPLRLVIRHSYTELNKR